MDKRNDPPRSAHYPPGYDSEDPYKDADIDAYPEWWRRNIETFRAHGMRPYRPSRFTDGAFVRPLLDRLEAVLGVSVRIRTADPDRAWALLVDGERVTTIDRYRHRDAYTVYEIEAREVERLARASVQREDGTQENEDC